MLVNGAIGVNIVAADTLPFSRGIASKWVNYNLSSMSPNHAISQRPWLEINRVNIEESNWANICMIIWYIMTWRFSMLLSFMLSFQTKCYRKPLTNKENLNISNFADNMPLRLLMAKHSKSQWWPMVQYTCGPELEILWLTCGHWTAVSCMREIDHCVFPVWH